MGWLPLRRVTMLNTTKPDMMDAATKVKKLRAKIVAIDLEYQRVG